MMNCGVYSITFPSGKQYIGSSSNINRRFIHHRYALRKGIHNSYKLQRAWRKYGAQGVVFKTLLICSRENLFFYEQKVIDRFKPSYNVATDVGLPSSRKGVSPSAETRAKLSAALIGKPLSDEHRAAISRGLYKRKPASKETCLKISEALKGRPKSPEHREKLAAALRGRKLPEEHRRNAAMAAVGRKHSAETIAKMSATKRKNDADKAAARKIKVSVASYVMQKIKGARR